MKITKRGLFQFVTTVTAPIWFIPFAICGVVWMLIDDMVIDLWTTMGDMYDEIFGDDETNYVVDNRDHFGGVL